MKCLRRYGQRSRRDTALRPGYTLIEMLIAVSLMVVLLTAVWGLLSMYSTLQTTGAEATAEQQLVRSVMQLIRNDLSKVPLPAADTAPALSDPFAAFDGAVADQGSASDAMGADTLRGEFVMNDLWRNENGGPANFSIRGTSNVIRMTVPVLTNPFESTNDSDVLDQPGSDPAGITQSLPDGTMPPVDEFQTIVYQFQQFGAAESGGLPFGLYRVQADAVRLQAMQAQRSQSEPDRAWGDFRLDRGLIEELLFPSDAGRSEQSGSTARQLARQPTCDWVPDVVSCQFEYRAGDRWHSNWKSGRANRLPLAIRVTLEVVSMRELDELRALYVPESPPGRLEQRLNRTLALTEGHAGPVRGPIGLNQLQITPRSYSSLVLLDSASAPSAHSSIDASLVGGSGQ